MPGLSGVNITIGTNRANASEGSIQYGTIGALLTARANYIQQLFANRGIATNVRTPNFNTSPSINVRINKNVPSLIGWNVTTQAMQRQVFRGNVIPGTTQSVPGSAPSTNFQKNTDGRPPTIGSYTGSWHS